MLFSTGDKILFTGDSVTDDGRGRPIGELSTGLGHGYVDLINSFLNVFYPHQAFRIVNTGNSGDTVVDLQRRWQRDVLDQQPDFLSICIGINDVWNQFQRPLQYEMHVYPDQYEQVLSELIESVLPSLKGLILMTPYYMERLKDDPMRARMDEYGAIVRKLAGKYNAIFVDLQAEFDNFFRYRHSSFVAWDRVHPNKVGCMIIANAFLKAVGFDISKGAM
ncbi:MAG TPA: SGNH/GDSL hydrolase family protein [Clostridia bacterium]|nr:SGNH/GDSL hydrolase family protein [Clostridia bacterium]